MKIVRLFSGLPSTGKSSVANWLSSNCGIVHFDLEQSSWPDDSLRSIWERSRSDFVSALHASYDSATLSWGFPPSSLQWVNELAGAGVEVFWFTGDEANLRVRHASCGKDTAAFDHQVDRIKTSNLPAHGLDQILCINIDGKTIDVIAKEILSRSK